MRSGHGATCRTTRDGRRHTTNYSTGGLLAEARSASNSAPDQQRLLLKDHKGYTRYGSERAVLLSLLIDRTAQICLVALGLLWVILELMKIQSGAPPAAVRALSLILDKFWD